MQIDPSKLQKLPDDVAAQWNGDDAEKKPFFQDLQLAAELKVADDEANAAAAHYRGMQEAEERVELVRAKERNHLVAQARRLALEFAIGAWLVSATATAALVAKYGAVAVLVPFVMALAWVTISRGVWKRAGETGDALRAAENQDKRTRQAEVEALSELVAKADELGDKYKERMAKRDEQVVEMERPIDDAPFIGQPTAIDSPQAPPLQLGEAKA